MAGRTSAHTGPCVPLPPRLVHCHLEDPPMRIVVWVCLLGLTTTSVALAPRTTGCGTAKRRRAPSLHHTPPAVGWCLVEIPPRRRTGGGRQSAASVVVWGDRQKEGKGWGIGDVFDLLEDKAGYEGFTEADLKVEGGVRDEKAATELSDKMKAREIDDAAKGGMGLQRRVDAAAAVAAAPLSPATSHLPPTPHHPTPQLSGPPSCYCRSQPSFLWFRVVRWLASAPSSQTIS